MSIGLTEWVQLRTSIAHLALCAQDDSAGRGGDGVGCVECLCLAAPNWCLPGRRTEPEWLPL
jgi:hypothetical protein